MPDICVAKQQLYMLGAIFEQYRILNGHTAACRLKCVRPVLPSPPWQLCMLLTLYDDQFYLTFLYLNSIKLLFRTVAVRSGMTYLMSKTCILKSPIVHRDHTALPDMYYLANCKNLTYV